MSDLQKPILFLDFDGTISSRDAVDVILETYADPKWLIIEDEWRAGRIGSRECLRAQMSLVRATRKQIDALLDEIGIDEGLVTLLEMCAMQDIPAHIVSDGFDYCIRRILSRATKRVAALLRGGRVCAAHLESRGHLWRTEFPFFHQTCGHGCATCKPAVMRLLNPTNAPAIFVGDGFSDRYAVESADLVFAKNGLASYCGEQSIEHTAYQNLGDVAAQIDRWMTGRVFLREETRDRVSA
ncbi:MAG: 2-hydroxy-3-keto-5-methylthiopentenyl-phosphate phosphatase [Blastocatellia bacterium]|jgi:2,3-diketo-5-methylthio-1-phosphopentane phosphatase|nr:2-hydroxy-3-keto-5-methylthiopentenyl-phosphate phosphatase [Blastocatellia bacterium]